MKHCQFVTLGLLSLLIALTATSLDPTLAAQISSNPLVEPLSLLSM
jgi:hypothetical protein